MASLGVLSTDDTYGHIERTNVASTKKRKKKEEAVEKTVDVKTTQSVKPQDIRTVKTETFEKNRSFKDAKKEQKKQTKSTTNDDLIDNAKFLGKSAKAGAVSGLTGIADVPLQETQNALEKGKNLKTPMDIVKNSTKGVIKGLSPSVGLLFDAYDKIKSNLKGERKNFAQSALDSYQSLYNATNPFEPVKDELTSLGAINPNLDEKVAGVREKLNAPADKMRQEVAEEAKNYSGVTNLLGSGMQTVGNMAPALITTAVTKNPELALYGVMGASAKGSATRDAELAYQQNIREQLQKIEKMPDGKEKNKEIAKLNEMQQNSTLDNAIKIGNVKAAGEVVSEGITGGLNLFGKGAIDDVAKNFIDKKVGSKGLNFLAKNVLGIAGEEAEELMTDALGFLIDRGTIDPNKKYTIDDLKETLVGTGVSTFLLNVLTGGYSRNAYNQNAMEMQQNRARVQQEKVNEIQQKVLNGEITYEQANEQLQQVQQGTYQNNRYLERVASEMANQVQQAVQTGQITQEEATQEMQAINNTLTSERERINKTNIAETKVEGEPEPIENATNKVEEPVQKPANDKKQTNNLLNNLKEDSKITVENKKVLNNRDYSKYDKLSDGEIKTLDRLYTKHKNGEKFTPQEQKEIDFLNRKQKGLKHPELTTNNAYEETRKELAKTNLNKYDDKLMRQAKEIVEANKQGKRTKQQWLDAAKYMGMQMQDADSKAIKEYALQTFKSERPNVKDNLNRQGASYVDFKVNEWVNAFYEGAGVGKQATTDLKEKTVKLKNQSGKEMTLKQDKNNPNIYNKEAPKTYGKSIVPKEVMENQLAKLKDGTKVSNFYSNITEKSKFITEENMEKLSQEEIWRYAPKTNKETMTNAAAKIGNTAKSLEKAYGEFMTKENFTAEDVAEGWIFLKRFQDAGNYEAMIQVAKKMKQSGTTGGQTIQAYNIMSRLTPEGMVKYAQSELMEAERAYNQGNSKKMIDKYAKNFELTGDEVQFIANTMKKVEKMEDGRAKDLELAKIQKMLQEKLPPQKGQALKGWMRISMLFNPKTQIRNIAGNAMITPVNAVADVAGSLVDRAIARQTEIRTLGAPSISSAAQYVKGAKKGATEAWQDYKLGVDTKEMNLDRFEVGQGKTFNEDNKLLKPFAKALNKTNDILGLAMSGGDRIFYQGAFESSLYNQMKLNNVDKPTQEMIDIATQEALSRTWNDSNDYTKFVIDIRNTLNKFSTKLTGSDAYGLGDVLIPFAKTPANLTKAIYEYSPAGLASSIFEAKNIKNTIETGQITPQMQHDFAQKVGKGVAGTMLYVLGYSLAKSGIITGSKDDDKDVANFVKNTMGIQPYSIKIGDHSYTYDWAQPVAAPFAIAADAYQNQQSKKGDDAAQVFNTIMDAANTGLNVLLSQSFFSGIQEVLNNNEGIVNGIQEQILSLPARAIPTFFKQINDMVDKTQRTSYERNQPLKTAKQNALAKTPLSKKLAPSVDTLGNEIQKYGGDKDEVSYFLKSFLSPSNTSNAQTSDVSKEIYKVYKETGDKTIMPKVAPYYITNKEIGTKDLTSQERAEYQKKSGKTVNKAILDLINNDTYKSMSYDEKAQVINGIVNYADAKAKEQLTGKISTYYSSADKKISGGMAISDYYLEKVLKKRSG